jgi:cell division protein FtsW (lipid II flippase)
MASFFQTVGQGWSILVSSFQELLQSLGSNTALMSALAVVLGGVFHYIMPLFALLVVVRCARSLFQSRLELENWGHLVLPDGSRLPLNHWENLIGRSRSADVVLNYNTVSRNHAALIRDSKGHWILHALHSKNGVTLNGRRVTDTAPVQARDIINFGGVETCFLPSTAEEERQQAARRVRPGKVFSPGITLFLLTLFQGMVCFQLYHAVDAEYQTAVWTCFGSLCLLMWGVYLIYRIFRRTGFEIETLAFFLTTLCLMITATSSPSGLKKQTFCVVLGLVLFFALSIALRNLELVMKIRWKLAVATMLLLAFNVLFGAKLFGAKNWLSIGPISFQPSEFVKIVFILVGATTLDRMFDKKNLLATLGYSAFCVGCLGLMSDFGTALIFFVSLLAITFLRSGDLASVLFMIAAAISGGYIILQFKSYIFARFAIYRHVWEDPANLGYQQTRTMSAIASGGLFGQGVGNGWLKKIGAANTDLVFGVVSEELGLIVAVLAVAVIIVLAIFAVREASIARSSFSVITACSAAMIFVVQTMLNVFGSTDLLPLTGVTLPFVSVGGSSMMSCWALLAFIKASDTRQNAGLAVRLPKRKGKNSPADEPDSWQTATGFYPRSTPEAADDGEKTVIMRPVKTPVSPAPKPATQPKRAKVEEPFPTPDFSLEEPTDADNWKDYFLKDEDWEDKP